jgi:hypothetical protein
VSSKQRKKRHAARARGPEAREEPREAPKAERLEVARRRAAARDERPPAPWGSFPLVELSVLVALVLLVVGAVRGADGVEMIVAGLVIGSLAGLELSIREHFAGFRSHTILLAGAAAIAALVVMTYVAPALVLAARVAIALAVFAGCTWALSGAFRRRAGVRVKLR